MLACEIRIYVCAHLIADWARESRVVYKVLGVLFLSVDLEHRDTFMQNLFQRENSYEVI